MKSTFSTEKFDLATFLDQIDGDTARPKIDACQYDADKEEVTFHLNTTLTSEENAQMISALAAHSGVPEAQLRVFRKLPLDWDPKISDFTILGFRKVAPQYDRGRKAQAKYLDDENGDLIVEKIFSDIRNESGRLTDLQCKFNYYAEDGSIGMSKTEIIKSFNKSEAKTEERKRRERQMDYLLAEAEYTDAEPILDSIYSHYYDEQQRYKEDGADVLAEALNNETDTTIAFYLKIRVPLAVDPSFTIPIKEAILYQIGALDEAGLTAVMQPAIGED